VQHWVQLEEEGKPPRCSYAKPNKQVRVFAVTSLANYEPEGREFESPRARHFSP